MGLLVWPRPQTGREPLGSFVLSTISLNPFQKFLFWDPKTQVPLRPRRPRAAHTAPESPRARRQAGGPPPAPHAGGGRGTASAAARPSRSSTGISRVPSTGALPGKPTRTQKSIASSPTSATASWTSPSRPASAGSQAPQLRIVTSCVLRRCLPARPPVAGQHLPGQGRKRTTRPQAARDRTGWWAARRHQLTVWGLVRGLDQQQAAETWGRRLTPPWTPQGHWCPGARLASAFRPAAVSRTSPLARTQRLLATSGRLSPPVAMPRSGQGSPGHRPLPREHSAPVAPGQPMAGSSSPFPFQARSPALWPPSCLCAPHRPAFPSQTPFPGSAQTGRPSPGPHRPPGLGEGAPRVLKILSAQPLALSLSRLTGLPAALQLQASWQPTCTQLLRARSPRGACREPGYPSPQPSASRWGSQPLPAPCLPIARHQQQTALVRHSGHEALLGARALAGGPGVEIPVIPGPVLHTKGQGGTDTEEVRRSTPGPLQHSQKEPEARPLKFK
ncbi:DBF4 zinc finger B [Phyllostomus discolor]|uniref:DBF4 zinc finger B n=1 Tax=Phyllostomus discolor TaxID=89673 RepID=A0A833ZFZ9_9CHIR|nr:DBF4 zinc finger B [Phyllostomus discolor]